MKKKLKKYANKLSEKNAAFAQISDLIQKKDEEKIKKSYSPSKEQASQLIELTSKNDKAIKEPLLNQSEVVVEMKSKNGYSEIGAEIIEIGAENNENKGILLDLEVSFYYLINWIII